MTTRTLPEKCPKCQAGRDSEYATTTCGYYHTSNSCPMRSPPERMSGRFPSGVEVTCGELNAYAITGKCPRSVLERIAVKDKDGADVERPWQYHIGDYEVRNGGIYTRDYNVRVATFAPNSYALRTSLARMFDAAHALVEAEKEALQLRQKHTPTRQALLEVPLDKKPKRKSKTVTVRGRKHWRAAKEFA